MHGFYWAPHPPDQSRWETVEWIQGDKEGPFEGQSMISTVAELLALERNGWLTIGVSSRQDRDVDEPT